MQVDSFLNDECDLLLAFSSLLGLFCCLVNFLSLSYNLVFSSCSRHLLLNEKLKKPSMQYLHC